jgi:NADPH:quinone reductase-like Zn-dependent oxidoreductase
LLALGANHVIVTDEEDLVARVQEITGGAGARIIFDAIAGAGIEALANAAARSATIFIYGWLSQQVTPFPVLVSWMKALKVQGYTLLEITNDPKLLQPATKYIFDKLANNVFKPRIDRTFTLAQIADAHRYMEAGEHIGKIVVTV